MIEENGEREQLERQNRLLDDELRIMYEKRNRFFQGLVNLYFFEYQKYHSQFLLSLFGLAVVSVLAVVATYLKYIDHDSLFMCFLFAGFYGLHSYKRCFVYARLLGALQYSLYDFGLKLVVDKSGFERSIRVASAHNDDRLAIYFNPNNLGSLLRCVNAA